MAWPKCGSCGRPVDVIDKADDVRPAEPRSVEPREGATGPQNEDERASK